MTRSVRLFIVGLLSMVLAVGLSSTGAVAATANAAPAAVQTPGCAAATSSDAAAATKVGAAQQKFKQAKKKAKQAKKTFAKKKTVKNKKAVTKAKKKKKKALARFKAAKNERTNTANRVVVFCGVDPTGPTGGPLPSSTPGTSPIQPLCEAIPQLKPLCDATTTPGNTTPLQPLCDAIPQLAPLCALKPGDLADPTQITNLINIIKANLPQGATLLTFLQSLITSLTSGRLQQVAVTLGTTPEVLANTLRGLGIPIPTVPGLPTAPGLPTFPCIPLVGCVL